MADGMDVTGERDTTPFTLIDYYEREDRARFADASSSAPCATDVGNAPSGIPSACRPAGTSGLDRTLNGS